MIYDGHLYCFPDLQGNAGWADRDEFMRHLQLATARHFQPAFRAGDRAPVDSNTLADLSMGWSFDALKDVNFRPAGYGRYEWEVDGETYYKQMMPPGLLDMTFSAESVVAQMDFAGVDMGLLHRTPYLGVGNDYIADCVKRFPDRLQGLAHVEEWLVQTQPDEALWRLRRGINELELHGLQWLPGHMELYGQSESWDSESFRPFWDEFAGLGVPVFFTLQPRAEPNYESYLEELRTVGRWMAAYPDVTVVLTHGLSWRMFMTDDGLDIPDAVLDAAPIDNPNLNLQLMFPIFLGREWDYPMPQVRPTVEMLVKRFGADRLIWGTDLPMCIRYYTYRQSLDFARLHWDFLGPQELPPIRHGDMRRARPRYEKSHDLPDEMALILGGNMARIMGIESS